MTAVAIGLIALAGLDSPGSSGCQWACDAVFYEVFVRSFCDCDGDGIGDLRGLASKLDYISDLGANAIWLMPIFPSPSEHGYDALDYMSINKDYGTMDDFRFLIAEAGKRNIRIILDLMVNHTSDRHPWFKKSLDKISPYDNYYLWLDKPPGGKWYVYGKDTPVLNGGWRYNPHRGRFFYAYFTERMPDLNLKNPLVREEFRIIAKFWLDKGVSGFRLDAARNIIEQGPGHGKQYDSPATIEWWREFNQYVKSVNPEAFLIGEVWAEYDTLSKYYAKGAGLDACFDFSLQRTILQTLRDGNAKRLADMITAKNSSSAPTGFYAPFLSNHDQDRYLTTLKNNLKKARPAVVLLLTAPGPVFIYYGEEIGMHQPAEKTGHHSVRTPMQWGSSAVTAGFTESDTPWTKIQNNADPYNVAYQQQKPDSLWSFYRELIRLRKDQSELRNGDYHFHRPDTGAIIFEKTLGPDKTLVMLNPSNQTIILNDNAILGRYRNLLNGGIVDIKRDFALGSGDCYLLKKLGR